MNGPFANECWKLAVKEIATPEAMGTRKVAGHSDGMNIIELAWAFKLKQSRQVD